MKKQMVAHFTYLITKDLVETLENKYGLEMTNSLSSQIKKIETEFVDKFWGVGRLPKTIDTCALDASMISAKLKKLLRGEPDFISLDRVYLPEAPRYLEATRRTDPKTGNVELTERPGTNPLAEQMNSFKSCKRVALADVGAFSGDTLLQICNLFENRGINVDRIYLGISNFDIGTKINGRKRLEVVAQFNFYEWIELRDIAGIDGRAVGMENGTRTYIPYWENMKGWASIPKETAEDTATLCKVFYSDLMRLIREEGLDINKIGKPIKYEGE